MSGLRDYMDNGNYVPYPLIRLPNGSLENPWSSANYLTDDVARAAVGGFTSLPFANTAAFRVALAANNNDVLKVFGLGGRTPATSIVNTVNPSALPVIVNSEPFLGGALDGEVFGIPVKLLLIGGVAWYLLKGGK